MCIIEELDSNVPPVYYNCNKFSYITDHKGDYTLVMKDLIYRWGKVYTVMKMYHNYDIDIDPLMGKIYRIYFMFSKDDTESEKDSDSDSDSDSDNDWD